ncbi:MAG: FAD-dependent oxidoreductase [Oligoflexales bacterium]|nr:FAD-dependent oxidoreductase [Oligoflexales bacterium]
MDKIRVKIDGREFEAAPGRSILDIARSGGIEIPTLCYHEKISKTTSCFVCLVKDKKSGRFLPSCSYEATDGMDLESSTDEVHTMRRTAFDLLLSEHTGDCEAPCTIACPAHAKVEEYVREGKKGNYLEALKIIKERVPLPMSIGRVCPRFCEKDCRRNVTDKNEPVAINDFKRIAADLHYETFMEDLPKLGEKKVAVVGAGPAGLSVAYFLRLNGISSDLYEKMPEAGGMLRYGIPEYRLPKAIVDKEIAHFKKMGGIQILYNKELGKDISIDELTKKYDAVAITVGSWNPSSMQTEGEELSEGGIRWLEKIARDGWKGKNPGKTVVIGGGNTAMDCVRTAVRLGSKDVTCCYRRTEHEMPAEKIEVEEAREEGVKFEFLTAPLKLREEKGRKILTCQKMRLGEPDASGRRRPVVIEGSEFDIEADLVISAIGQKTVVPSGVKSNKWGDVEVSRQDYSVDGKIFAAGDCVTGPASVVEAVAAGRIVACGIQSHFEGRRYKNEYEINVSRGSWGSLAKNDLVFLKEPVESKREKQVLIPIAERMTTFKEVAKTFTSQQIEREGQRCFECSCTAKGDCKLKQHSEEYGASPDKIKGEKRKHGYDTRHSSIILDRGKCIKCGICVKLCKEVVSKSLLGFKQRGYEVNVGVAFNRPLPESCTSCGECVRGCPMGALDWKVKN